MGDAKKLEEGIDSAYRWTGQIWFRPVPTHRYRKQMDGALSTSTRRRPNQSMQNGSANAIDGQKDHGWRGVLCSNASSNC